MFIAMNRFKVVPGGEARFEEIWRNRDSRLGKMPGFIAFHLLRGAQGEDHTLYSSHTVWRSRDDFVGWTRSEHFRKTHKNAGDNADLYLGHPQFEGFEVVDGVS